MLLPDDGVIAERIAKILRQNKTMSPAHIWSALNLNEETRGRTSEVIMAMIQQGHIGYDGKLFHAQPSLKQVTRKDNPYKAGSKSYKRLLRQREIRAEAKKVAKAKAEAKAVNAVKRGMNHVPAARKEISNLPKHLRNDT